ncbi:MAG: 23S rRNA pseudouridine(955/2504/2580) synthase, partial [Gammaproteobacteria bacterium]|nr:23S rRNA pseudouridine(955/2504/2580) synthase [Gammaproteobacteria bacterium]
IIETGRTHQIRAHAKYANHSIAGDDKYGDKIFEEKVHNKGLKRLFLHAHQVIFTNPMSNKIEKVKAPLTKDLIAFLDKL